MTKQPTRDRHRYPGWDDAYKLRVWQMHLGEALVPEAHCSTPVLEHGNNHHRNSSSERNCISHSRCFFMPIPAHSITHLKPDGALSISLFLPLCFPSLSRVVQFRALGNKNWQNILNICLSRQKGQKNRHAQWSITTTIPTAACTVILGINNMSCLSPECRIHHCLCCSQRNTDRKHCILDWRMEQGGAASAIALPHRS